MKLRYKNYIGTYEYDPSSQMFEGRILGIEDIVHFCAKKENELPKALEEAVEDYLNVCKKTNTTPSKSYTGELKIRTTPEVHLYLVRQARFKGISLNAYLRALVEKPDSSRVKK